MRRRATSFTQSIADKSAPTFSLWAASASEPIGEIRNAKRPNAKKAQMGKVEIWSFRPSDFFGV
jgi:hypothetical protein